MRSPRIRLRTLMLLVAALALGMGWNVTRARAQRRAVETIRRIGGDVWYDFEFEDGRPIGRPAESPVPRWVLDRVGIDHFHWVVGAEVNFSGPGRITDAWLLDLT